MTLRHSAVAVVLLFLCGGALGACREDRHPTLAPTAQGQPGHPSRSTKPESSSSSVPVQERSKADSAASASADAAPGCPPEMVAIPPYCIDRYEAHLVVLGAGDAGAAYPHYERPARGVEYRAVSAPGVFPQAYINREESAQACAQAGKRLCTVLEWYKACQGPQGWVYPYGNQLVRSKCNSSKPHLLSKLFGSNPRQWKYEEHFNSPKLDQEPGFLARTGEYCDCVSGYGVRDLVGNLHEWVSDKVDGTLPSKIPLQEDVLKKVGRRTGNALFLGGFFSTTSEHGPGCRFVTIGHEATYHDYSTGFRCCRDL